MKSTVKNTHHHSNGNSISSQSKISSHQQQQRSRSSSLASIEPQQQSQQSGNNNSINETGQRNPIHRENYPNSYNTPNSFDTQSNVNIPAAFHNPQHQVRINTATYLQNNNPDSYPQQFEPPSQHPNSNNFHQAQYLQQRQQQQQQPYQLRGDYEEDDTINPFTECCNPLDILLHTYRNHRRHRFSSSTSKLQQQQQRSYMMNNSYNTDPLSSFSSHQSPYIKYDQSNNNNNNLNNINFANDNINNGKNNLTTGSSNSNTTANTIKWRNKMASRILSSNDENKDDYDNENDDEEEDNDNDIDADATSNDGSSSIATSKVSSTTITTKNTKRNLHTSSNTNSTYDDINNPEMTQTSRSVSMDANMNTLTRRLNAMNTIFAPNVEKLSPASCVEVKIHSSTLSQSSLLQAPSRQQPPQPLPKTSSFLSSEYQSETIVFYPHHQQQQQQTHISVLCSVDVLKMRSEYFQKILTQQEKDSINKQLLSSAVASAGGTGGGSKNKNATPASSISSITRGGGGSKHHSKHVHQQPTASTTTAGASTLWRPVITLTDADPTEAVAFLEALHEGSTAFKFNWNIVWARLCVQLGVNDVVLEYATQIDAHFHRLLLLFRQHHWRLNPSVLASYSVAVVRHTNTPTTAAPSIMTGNRDLNNNNSMQNRAATPIIHTPCIMIGTVLEVTNKDGIIDKETPNNKNSTSMTGSNNTNKDAISLFHTSSSLSSSLNYAKVTICFKGQQFKQNHHHHHHHKQQQSTVSSHSHSPQQSSLSKSMAQNQPFSQTQVQGSGICSLESPRLYSHNNVPVTTPTPTPPPTINNNNNNHARTPNDYSFEVFSPRYRLPQSPSMFSPGSQIPSYGYGLLSPMSHTHHHPYYNAAYSNSIRKQQQQQGNSFNNNYNGSNSYSPLPLATSRSSHTSQKQSQSGKGIVNKSHYYPPPTDPHHHQRSRSNSASGTTSTPSICIDTSSYPTFDHGDNNASYNDNNNSNNSSFRTNGEYTPQPRYDNNNTSASAASGAITSSSSANDTAINMHTQQQCQECSSRPWIEECSLPFWIQLSTANMISTTDTADQKKHNNAAVNDVHNNTTNSNSNSENKNNNAINTNQHPINSNDWLHPDEHFMLVLAPSIISPQDKRIFWEMIRCILDMPSLTLTMKSSLKNKKELFQLLKSPEYKVLWSREIIEYLPLDIMQELVQEAYIASSVVV